MTRRYSSTLIVLFIAAAVALFLLMVAGNAVRVLDAAGACPDWPTCYGMLLAPVDTPLGTPLGLQVLHRYLAAISTGLVIISAVLAVVRRIPRKISMMFTAAALILIVQSLFGAFLIQSETPPLASTLHLLAALAAFGLVIASLTIVLTQQFQPRGAPQHFAFRAPFARKTLWGLAALLVVLISGSAVTVTGAAQACSDWPLCSGSLPVSGLGWLALQHRLVVLAAGILLLIQSLNAWRSQRSQVRVLPAASAVLVLLFGQVFLGALHSTRGYPLDLVGLHAAVSAAIWAAQVVLVVSAGLSARTADEEAVEAAEPLDFARRAKDFVILSKPIIVLLLLVTTYAGLVVGGGALPSASLTFWTLLGGGLAAGGASALNQYIDRETDKAMQRTARRPLPAQRLKPAEGLAYGIAVCLLAFFLMAGMVNLLAAVLSLAGMIYYVLLYSVWLKHATVQNIVIGGGAGAIPPLVGWAAATGSLNLPALMLFAIIFLWTPPHFWALALVRRSDYARGKVPMLPVVRGEEETRKQILFYTVQLVLLTLLLPAFRVVGVVYFVTALVLGLWLLSTAWKVYRLGGNKLAWKMYRYSSMYLAFLMAAMVIDILV